MSEKKNIVATEALLKPAKRRNHNCGPVFEARSVAFAFPHAEKPVFERLSFEAHAGTMTAILGNNGAGKSTLLNLLASITTPSAGEVRVGGKPHVSWNISEHDRAVVAAALKQLELEPFVDRYCDELSGGERQKVYIARAIAQQTETLLLDEPTSALDPKNQMEVLQVVRDITTQTSLATVMVIHDVNLALRFCDRFVLMRNGTIVAQGGIEAVTEEALSETYDMPMRIAEIDNLKLTIPTAS